MIIDFLGDSITEGAGATKEEFRFVNRVGKILGVTALNHGLGGTRIAKRTLPSDWCPIYDKNFTLRMHELDKNADFVFVFGGTNDHGHGDADLGDMTSTSEYTFFGAMKTLLTYLTDTFGNNKVCVILPLPKYDQDNLFGENGNQEKQRPPLSEFIKAEKTVAEYFGVDTLDFSDLFPKPKVKTGDELTADGIHPNDKGHLLIANRVSEYLKNKLKCDFI